MLIGGLLAFSLSGCLNMQCIMYWRQYPGEPYRVKSLVIATWLLDLCHSAFVAIALWDSIIVPYGDFSKLDHIPWSVGPAVELTALITFLAQSFFAYRIYRLMNKKLAVVIPIVVLAFCRLVAASVTMGEMISLESYAEFSLPFPGWIFALGLTLSAIVDIMITSSLCYFLRKNRTTITKLTYSYPSNRTIYVIDTLTSWTIQNGSITCAGTVASLLCWEAMPQNRIFLGLHFAVAKFYANSLLATLNARQQMRDARQYGSPDSRPLPVLSPEDFGNIPRTFRSPYGFSTRFDPRQLRAGDLKYGQPIQVNVERVVDSKYDDDGIKLEEPRSHADGDSAV